jgi:photosystem II stability/assembly factor-like uncharacterized protein
VTRGVRTAVVVCAAVGALGAPASMLRAQPVATIDPSAYGALQWRMIGPFRGGRTVAVSGVPGDGRTFYMGAVGGGVWKTTNAGRTWNPVSDALPVSSIGALAVAPSDPSVVYAGSGEADMRSDIIHGNGMYRSADAGATWTAIGLADSRQIGRILVDPADPNTLLVAALGHAYGPNEMRGVYRSTDGGATWTRTLFHDRDTGAIDLAADPSLHVVFASLWQTRRPPWSVYPPSKGPGSGLYRSVDGGVTWSQLTGNGFPSTGLGKVGLAVAPSNPQRVYAIVDAKDGGLYRSDDSGASWKKMTADGRLWQRGWYFCHVAVDPKNADVVYISDTAFYRSTDGGATFTAIKGSPDGDDFHQLWIDPLAPEHLALASDQGTSISVDGAKTWSSWFNQPTGQFYHVATDTAFPYHLYGAQQDSGAAQILSRSSHVGIDDRDWRPITAGGESGSLLADPHDPTIVFGRSGNGVDREDLVTSTTRSIPLELGQPGVWRSEWTMPIAEAIDGTLYASYQNIWKSRDRGAHWSAVSGDLTRPRAATPATLDAPSSADADGPPPRGVVYALATSPRAANVVWAGTDDGLVYRSGDAGRSWHDVTPPHLAAWSHIDTIDASHADAATAYVAIDRHRLDDDGPAIAITHDGGRTWREAVTGLPSGNVNVVREDPLVPKLLYAGTEHGVFVSFDGGARWQSLQLNLPDVSVRDISVRDGDLAIATHGRAFWILDDVAPLRDLARAPTRGTRLFAPRAAFLLPPANDEAEAVPPEEPRGTNPPDGAFIDYALAPNAGTVTLAIDGPLGVSFHRRSTDTPKVPTAKDVDFPAYWIVPPPVPSAQPGFHRFVWNLRAGTASEAPFVPPGRYTIRLMTSAGTFTQTVVVLRDPRGAATDADLRAQYTLARDAAALTDRVNAAIAAATALRTKHPALASGIDAIAGESLHDDPDNSTGTPLRFFTTLRYYAVVLTELRGAVESAPAAPTADARSAWVRLRGGAERALRDWSAFVRLHGG